MDACSLRELPARTVALAALVVTGLAAQADPWIGRVEGIEGGNCLVMHDGSRVRLQGVTLPTPCIRSSDCVARLRTFLRERAVGRELTIVPDGVPPVDDDADHLGLAFTESGRPSLNEQILERGLAVFGCRSAVAESRGTLLAAARRAQLARRGRFAGTPRGRVESLPFLNGAVLGLHHRDPSRPYDRELGELAELGFRHVTLIFPAFLADVSAWRIDRHHPRSVDDVRLIETIRTARQRHGMTVTLLPIVLLETAGDDDWRGTIRPEPEERFWLAYDSFLSHYLDIAESTGAETFSVGSEFGSLEDRTATWCRLIENARGRFTGLLTYSANWDHVHVPRFFGELDAVGMTAYFSLTEDVDPTREQIVAAWRRVGAKLRETTSHVDRPLFFTELGYASQNGINTDPWNYFIAVDDIDLAEQHDCFAAVLEVVPELDFVHGAFWFDYFGDGGRGDSGYSPRGKPALAAWRAWAALECDRPIERLRDR